MYSSQKEIDIFTLTYILDTLYLNGCFYFDNIEMLDTNKIFEILPIYNSVSLMTKIEKI